MIAGVETVAMPASLAPNAAPTVLVFVVMATLIMWFSARVVGVSKVSLLRAFMATAGVSVIVGAVVTAMSAYGTTPAIMLGVVGLVGCLWVLRQVFKIPTFPAFLIFVVNVMVQMILISLYLRPFLNAAPTK